MQNWKRFGDGLGVLGMDAFGNCRVEVVFVEAPRHYALSAPPPATH